MSSSWVATWIPSPRRTRCAPRLPLARQLARRPLPSSPPPPRSPRAQPMLLPLRAGAAWLKHSPPQPATWQPVETRQGCSTDSGLLSSSPPHHRLVAFQHPGGRKRACPPVSLPSKVPKAGVGASGSDSRPPTASVASSRELQARLEQASPERSAHAFIVQKSPQMKVCALLPLRDSFPQQPCFPALMKHCARSSALSLSSTPSPASQLRCKPPLHHSNEALHTPPAHVRRGASRPGLGGSRRAHACRLTYLLTYLLACLLADLPACLHGG